MSNLHRPGPVARTAEGTRPPTGGTSLAVVPGEAESWPGSTWVPWALVALAGLAYSNSFAGPFVFDDVPSIVENPQIRGWNALHEVFTDPGRVDITVSGRPVAAWSLALNHALGGLQVFGYHLLNLAIHAASGLLLYGIVRRVLRLPRPAADSSDAVRASVLPKSSADRDLWAAAVAAIFLLHPLQTESVTYVVQRVESLAALWFLAVLYFVLRSATAANPRRAGVAAVVCCALGMGTKEVMVAAPIAALLFDRAFLSGGFGAAWRARGRLYLGLASTWGILAWLVATSPRLRVAGEAATSLGPFEYARIQAGAILRYLGLAAFPKDLVFDYGIVGDGVAIPQAFGEYAIQGAVILALVLASLWAIVRNRPTGAVAAIAFLLLAPSSSVVPIRLEPIAEHRMYLPIAALAILLIAALTRGLERFGPGRGARRAAIAGIVIALAFGARTYARNQDYSNAVALWEDTVAKRPGSARALTNLGLELEKVGQASRALELHREAARVRPDYSEAHHNLASALLVAGDTANAEVAYRRALELDPRAVESRVGLAECLVRANRLDEAAAEFEAALQQRADLYGAHRSLAAIRMQQQRLDESAAHFAAALRLDGSDARLWNLLGTIHAQQGKLDLAAEHFRAALRVQPGFADALGNLERLAQLRQSGQSR